METAGKLLPGPERDRLLEHAKRLDKAVEMNEGLGKLASDTHRVD